MSEPDEFVLRMEGSVIGHQRGAVELWKRGVVDDGIEVLVGVRMPDYTWQSRTMITGFAFKSFLADLAAVRRDDEKTAVLWNYDQSLTLELRAKDGSFVVAIDYRSPNPSSEEETEVPVGETSPSSAAGSSFCMPQFKVDVPSLDIVQSELESLLAWSGVSTESPFQWQDPDDG